LKANVAAFDRVRLRPRVLTDVSTVDTTVSVFGTGFATPVGVAPTAYHRLVDAEGEVATARGASTAGALFVVSVFASRTLEDIAAASTGPLWLHLYWFHRREVMTGLIRRATAAGYGALVLTVDAPRIGRRWRDMRNGFAIGGDVAAVNIDAAVMALTHHSDVGHSAIAEHAAHSFDPGVTWADLAWLRTQTSLPIVLKGILTAEDAALAVEHGVDGIVVSNHGGRQLDGAVASLDALPEVVDAVGGALPVLFDGGVRRGSDALTALALGARMVLLGRPPLWALAAGGAEGVAGLLRTTTEELALAMALAGRPCLAELDRSVVKARAGGEL
jgi:4-hydroxymandelate oxidase